MKCACCFAPSGSKWQGTDFYYDPCFSLFACCDFRWTKGVRKDHKVLWLLHLLSIYFIWMWDLYKAGLQKDFFPVELEGDNYRIIPVMKSLLLGVVEWFYWENPYYFHDCGALRPQADLYTVRDRTCPKKVTVKAEREKEKKPHFVDGQPRHRDEETCLRSQKESVVNMGIEFIFLELQNSSLNLGPFSIENIRTRLAPLLPYSSRERGWVCIAVQYYLC